LRLTQDAEGVRLAARIDRVAAADLAAQSPVLAWLGVLDAPLSGEVEAAFTGDGDVGAIAGRLDIAAGGLRPAPDVPPVTFDRAGLGFAYDPASGRIRLSDLAVDSASLRLAAHGHVDLDEIAGGVPGAFVGQIAFDRVMIDPAGLFEEPVRFSQGALDLRLRLDPFDLTIGQLMLAGDGHRLLGSGAVSAAAGGWSVALDVALDAIPHDGLLALWPLRLAPKTRDWVAANVQEGLLFDVRAAVRQRPGMEPRLSLGYEFADADVRVLRTLPPIEAGAGYSTLENTTYTLVLDRGRLTPPEGGAIDVSGSVFRVPDVTARPGTGEVRLVSDSTITAALSLLDQPPFGFLSRAGIAVDLAEGRARLDTRLSLPLIDNVPADEVDFAVTGTLSEVRSERMAPGRSITARSLRLTADSKAVVIEGEGLLDALPFEAAWRQPLGPGGGGSVLTGSVPLGPAFRAAFLPGLPADALTGDGVADFEIALGREAPPRFTLRSDLNRSALRLDAIGWSKPANATGLLEVAGMLGRPPTVDRIVLRGPGLSAEGRLALDPDGALDRLTVDRFDLGGWVQGTAVLAPGPRGRLDAAVTGGSADLRRMPDRGFGGGAGGSAVTVALDRLTISGGIALTGFRGSFDTRGGLNGRFAGRINGEAPVEGRMEPSPQGSAFRISAADAGAVFRAAGIFTKMHGGSLDMTLMPTGARGTYDGRIALGRFRVRNLSVLADLLNAISIVGLLEQLSTSGLLFENAAGRFRLTPDELVLQEGSAVGASFGVSMEGRYRFGAGAIDLRGVISPFYLVNGIGAVLTRPGEGLIGMNYRIGGSAEAPRVTVNPLSALTPGFLREIFRGPASGAGARAGGRAAPVEPHHPVER
jgi:hypothetical protein